MFCVETAYYPPSSDFLTFTYFLIQSFNKALASLSFELSFKPEQAAITEGAVGAPRVYGFDTK